MEFIIQVKNISLSDLSENYINKKRQINKPNFSLNTISANVDFCQLFNLNESTTKQQSENAHKIAQNKAVLESMLAENEQIDGISNILSNTVSECVKAPNFIEFAQIDDNELELMSFDLSPKFFSQNLEETQVENMNFSKKDSNMLYSSDVRFSNANETLFILEPKAQVLNIPKQGNQIKSTFIKADRY